MMKFKIKKDIFLKKSTWLVLGVFAITLVNIPRFRTQAAGSSDPLKFEPDTLQILEIMPGNESALSNTKTNPNSEEEREVGGQKVHITHVNMPQFISQTDDIEGKYDVVAITNAKNNDVHDKYWSDATYRQYTSPFAEKMAYGKYLSSANNKDMGSYLLSSSDHEEYYPENDITNKRAKLIVDMINKGQLVYIDQAAASVAGTKLNSNFNTIGDKPNYKKVPASSITLENIVNDYKSITNKRVKVSSASGPVSEEWNSDYTKTTKERQLNFSVTANAESTETLTFNVYLDFDGDGLFTGDPYYTTTRNGSNSYQTYDLSTAINNGFIGYLGWKVDIVRENGVKTSIVSYAQYHAQNGPQEIKVLQIYPNNDNWSYFDNRNGKQGSSNTRLTKSADFMKLLENKAVSSDYKITVNDLSVNEFENTYGSSANKKHLQDDYDMVIVGFADYYAGADISNSDALTDLDNFIKAGKSVMFTHDTIGLGIEGKSSGPKVFAQHYKALVGQSRYKDKYSASNDICPDINDYDKQSKGVTYKGITYDSSNGKILGQTPLSICGTDITGNIPKDFKGEVQNGSRLWETTQTNTVKNVNNAQITTYPYDLRTYNNGNGTLDVSLTHTQWFQLNLEDPQIVPWYNLVGGYMNSGDSRNFYYTYSKKNITYSGTGHSGVPTQPQELELFVNTIVKAFRGSNGAPTVTNYSDDSKSDDKIIANNSQVPGKIKTSEDYTFYTMPTDPDNDNLSVTINMAVSNENANEKDLQYSNLNTINNYTSTEPIKVTVSKDTLEKLPLGSTLYFKVTAKDPLGEQDTKTFRVVCSGNRAPDVTNYNASSGDNKIQDDEIINVSRQNNFNFTSLLNDPDEEDKGNLKYDIKVDGNDSIGTLMLDNKQVTRDDSFTNGDKINVTLPDSIFEGKNTGDTIKVETTVTDLEGKSRTRAFTLKIGEETPNTVLNIVKKVNADGSFDEEDNNKTFTNLEVAQFAGKVSNVYDAKGTIKLEIPKELEVQGDMTVKRVVDNKLTDLPGSPKMTKDESQSNDLYSVYKLDLASSNVLSLGAVEKYGMTFIVQYEAKVNDTAKVNDAKDHATVTKTTPVKKTVINSDGSTTITTTWQVRTVWSYTNTFISTLSFDGAENSTKDLKLEMGEDNTKNNFDEQKLPPEIVPDNKQKYMNVDLF